MADSCFVLHVSLQDIPYKKSFELRVDYIYVKLSGIKSPWKNVICPLKVLEKYLKRKVSGLYEP